MINKTNFNRQPLKKKAHPRGLDRWIRKERNKSKKNDCFILYGFVSSGESGGVEARRQAVLRQ